jgi:hypothetical protein
MTDLVSFLEALATDDGAKEQYDADPIGFVGASDLDEADKTLLMTANNSVAINQAVVDRAGGSVLEVAGAGNVRYQVTLLP